MKKLFSKVSLMALGLVALSMTSCTQKPAEPVKVKKDIAFQMYSVRELIGDPGKYAENHEATLKALDTAIRNLNLD